MALFWMQLLVVLTCIAVGGRYGGVGLGAAGGLGMSILVLVFGMQPASPPVSVILIITAVIACCSVLQAAGGLDYLVTIAEKALRKKPDAITFIAPLICGTFTFFCGTAYVAFSVYPVIAEVAAEAKIRPERPLSMSVYAADISITASPMSAATAGMIGILASSGVSPLKLVCVMLPSVLFGIFIGCLSVYRRGAELEHDPEFKRRVAAGEYQSLHVTAQKEGQLVSNKTAIRGLTIFAIGVATVVCLGSMKWLLPTWEVNGKVTSLPIPSLIQMVMLSAAFFIMVLCRVPGNQLAAGSVFRSGLIGVVGVFGVAWMTGTFFEAYEPLFKELFRGMVQDWPMLFGIVLFCFSSVIFSPAATVAALMPLGLQIGIPPQILVALFPAVCGAFIIPGAMQIGCVAFDRTGTTKIGRFVVNHSYMRPGLVTCASAVFACYFMSKMII